MVGHGPRGTAEAIWGGRRCADRIKPVDEIEGMSAAQMVATHNTVMECFQRSMIREQTFEGHCEALNQVNKLTRSYVMLLEALNRHRGKGQ